MESILSWYGGKCHSFLGQVRDEKGRKMSKSLGNVVDPVDVIANNSCDALRLTLATGLWSLPDSLQHLSSQT